MRRYLLFRSHRSGKLAALIVLALLTVASCGSEGGSQGDQSEGKDTAGVDGSTRSAQSATTAETTEGGEQKGGGQKGRGQKDGGQNGGATIAQTATGAMKVRDGTFKVDKAGSVKFQLDNNALKLQDVSPNSGWRQQIAAQSSDDIEIDFRQGKAKAEFGAELDDGGRLALEINQKLKGPVPS